MTKKFVVENQDKERLDVFLLKKLEGKTRSHIKNLILEGNVLVDGGKFKAGHELKFGSEVEVNFPENKTLSIEPEHLEVDIVFEDSNLILVNKPQGMVVHPANGNHSGTLVNALLFAVKDLSGINGTLRPGIVHRLDKDTSGLMLVAKNDFTHVNLQRQIQEKICKRKYLALTYGEFKENSGRIDTFFGRHPKERKKMAVLTAGRRAATSYRVVKRFVGYTLVEFELETGRTHQIRVHSQHIGHPIVGDMVYGRAEKKLAGQLLHSYHISFVMPNDETKRQEFQSELPKYFSEFMKNLKVKE